MSRATAAMVAMVAMTMMTVTPMVTPMMASMVTSMMTVPTVVAGMAMVAMTARWPVVVAHFVLNHVGNKSTTDSAEKSMVFLVSEEVACSTSS